jgi:hypothetical protein
MRDSRTGVTISHHTAGHPKGISGESKRSLLEWEDVRIEHIQSQVHGHIPCTISHMRAFLLSEFTMWSKVMLRSQLWQWPLTMPLRAAAALILVSNNRDLHRHGGASVTYMNLYTKTHFSEETNMTQAKWLVQMAQLPHPAMSSP